MKWKCDASQKSTPKLKLNVKTILFFQNFYLKKIQNSDNFLFWKKNKKIIL